MMKDPNAAPEEKRDKNGMYENSKGLRSSGLSGHCPNREEADVELLSEESLSSCSQISRNNIM